MVRFSVFAAASAILAATALAAVAAPGDRPVSPPPAAGHHAAAPAVSHRESKAAGPGPAHRAEEHHPAAARKPEPRPAAPSHRSSRHSSSRRNGCVSQRGTIALVQAGRVVALSAIRTEAERRGNGELINAELCHRGGRLTYLVSVLAENGRVVHLSFDAASGRLMAAGR